MKYAIILRTLIFAILGCSAIAVHGGSPLERLSLFKRLEADPNKTYLLTEDRGPWLILAATFFGEEAEQQADALVLELRREFKLPAYRHAMVWDFTNDVQGRGLDQYGRPKVMRHANYEKREEIAVLIGDFITIDDPAAQQTLQRVRYMKPQCLDPEFLTKNGQTNTRAFAGWRLTANMFSGDPSKKTRGPMSKAFLVSNPMIPQEYFRPKGVDPFVERLNAPLEFSLLNCPGQYTVKVATFTGTTVMLQKDVEKVMRGEKRIPGRLEQAAMQAHLMTIALRAKGFEAYEFHEESSSVVTVGSFDRLGTTRPDGTIDYDPQIRRVAKEFEAEVLYENGVAKAKPKNILGAEFIFDVDPTAMEVPKRSVSAAYTRR